MTRALVDITALRQQLELLFVLAVPISAFTERVTVCATPLGLAGLL